MKKCFCPPTVKSKTYHIYVKPDRGTVEYVVQKNRFEAPTDWATTLDQALDDRLTDILNDIIELEIALPYFKQIKNAGLKPFSFRPYFTYEQMVRNLKHLQRELSTLLTNRPVRWQD